MDHIALMPHRHGKAAALEDVQHGTIAGKHVGLKPIQALHPGDGDDMTHQQAADPAALEVLFDGPYLFGELTMADAMYAPVVLVEEAAAED